MVRRWDRPPFRFAVQATNAAGCARVARYRPQGEDLGYSTLFLADHYLGPGPRSRRRAPRARTSRPSRPSPRPRRYTTTLRVGCRVFCIDYHVPAVLAKEVATLDLLSDGRLELGIGAGWSGVEYEAMGLTFDTPGTANRQAQGGRRARSRHTAPATNSHARASS